MKNQIKRLTYLVLDIQATNPNPKKGVILEIGWGKYQYQIPVKDALVVSLVNRISDEIEIPRQALRITGIDRSELEKGTSLEEVWRHLGEMVEMIKTENKSEACPTIIHFARYERSFLEALHTPAESDSRFPFDVFCTHEIAKRLWPDLPRKGLRAIAGFLGWSTEELRRSEHHVQATMWIWRHCIDQFAEMGVTDLETLRDWIETTKPVKAAKRAYPMLEEKRQDLPNQPGIYHMLRSNGDLLYVGKATSLKQRVGSYFQKSSRHAEHILEMLSQARDLKTYPTASVVEAALTENDQIKEFTPPYNKALKSGNRELFYMRKSDLKPAHLESKTNIIGPIPDPDPFFVISYLCKLRINRSAEIELQGFPASTFRNIFDLPPADDILREGVGLFFDQSIAEFSIAPTPMGFIRLGGKLRIKKRDEEFDALDAEIEEDELDEEVLEEEWEWTAERIAKRLESVLRHAHKLVFRARWFNRLSNATIAWDGRKSGRNILSLENAKIVKSATVRKSRISGSAFNQQTRSKAPQTSISLADFDRLRILTTELKRLVKENRSPIVYLGESQKLSEPCLDDILEWV